MDYFYAPMFQLGKDTTEYYCLTKEGVSVSEFEGHKILKVAPEALEALSHAAFRDVNFLLRRSHNAQVASMSICAGRLHLVLTSSYILSGAFWL